MPIYEYRCTDCGLKFELLRPISQSNDFAACPSCCKPVKRAPSLFASFSKGKDGMSTPIAGSSSCGGCTASSCSTCGG